MSKEPKTVDLLYKGNKYTAPASPFDLPAEYIEGMHAKPDANLAGMVEAILGPEQYATFKATRPTVRDLDGLIKEYGRQIVGVKAEPGESAASSD